MGAVPLTRSRPYQAGGPGQLPRCAQPAARGPRGHAGRLVVHRQRAAGPGGPVSAERRRDHHFVDEQTGAVEAFSDDELERAIDAVAQRLGVTLSGHDVVLRGARSTG